MADAAPPPIDLSQFQGDGPPPPPPKRTHVGEQFARTPQGVITEALPPAPKPQAKPPAAPPPIDLAQFKGDDTPPGTFGHQPVWNPGEDLKEPFVTGWDNLKKGYKGVLADRTKKLPGLEGLIPGASAQDRAVLGTLASGGGLVGSALADLTGAGEAFGIGEGTLSRLVGRAQDGLPEWARGKKASIGPGGHVKFDTMTPDEATADARNAMDTALMAVKPKADRFAKPSWEKPAAVKRTADGNNLLAEGAKRMAHGVRETVSRMRDAADAEPGRITKKQAEAGRASAEADVSRKVGDHLLGLDANRTEKILGKPITAAEARGRKAVAQLKVAIRRAGEGGKNAQSFFYDRLRDTGKRVAADFQKITGIDPVNAHPSKMRALAEQMRAKAKVEYDKWHAHTNVDSDALAAVRKKHSFKEGMKEARRLASDDGVNAEGEGLEGDDKLPWMVVGHDGVPVTIKSGGKPVMVPREQAIAEAAKAGFEHPGAAEEVERVPTPRGYDYVKRGLDQLLEEFRNKTTGYLDLSSPKARAIYNVRKELHEALVNHPEAGADAAAAYEKGGDAPRMEEAYEDIHKLMSNTVTEDQFKQRTKGWTADQWQAARHGVVQHAQELAAAGNDKVFRKWINDLGESKLTMLFGKEQAAALMEHMRAELEMMSNSRHILGGSDTFENFAADKEAEDASRAGQRAAKAVFQGKPRRALSEVVTHTASGLIDGARQPINEVGRDRLGELWGMSPSKLAEFLRGHGEALAQAQERAQTTRLRKPSALGPAMIAAGAADKQGQDRTRRLNQPEPESAPQAPQGPEMPKGDAYGLPPNYHANPGSLVNGRLYDLGNNGKLYWDARRRGFTNRKPT